jgi:uncharacterized membrane protein
MGWFEKKDDMTKRPEEVPPEQLSQLSRTYLNWKSGMALVVLLCIVVLFVKTATEPVITSFATAEAAAEKSERFASTLSLLFVIFAFFAIVLIAFVQMRKKQGK